MRKLFIFPLIFISCYAKHEPVVTSPYLNNIKSELNKRYPDNKTINLVFHGHSVPAGYTKTPVVNTFESYPYLLLKDLKTIYPYAVINIIVTAIGGENSVSGERRFDSTVLIYKPDVLFIDYALNDRSVGLDSSRIAWEKMIEKALARNIKVILLTPSPDLTDSDKILSKYTQQIIALSKKYGVGLANSSFDNSNLSNYMAQDNHPNENGNRLIAQEIIKYFR